MKYLPHVAAFLILFAVSAAFFAKQFDGYKLRQSDHINYLGMSKEIDDFYEVNGEETFWTNSMFSGMPSYQINVTTPWYVDLLTSARRAFNRIFEMPYGYILLGMLGFYLLLYWFGVNSWLAIIGAVAFGLSSINILFLAGGHNSKVIAISLIPTLVGSLFYAFRKNKIRGALMVSIFTALHVSANHLQMTYYLLFMIFGIAIYEIIRLYKLEGIPSTIRTTALILGAGVIGILPSTSNLLATYKYGTLTTRGKSELTIDENQKSKEKSSQSALGKEYIKEYSMGTGETWSIVVPNIKGGTAGYIKNNPELLSQVSPQMKEMVGSQSTYWGEQRFSGGAFYFGAAIFMLFVLALFFLKDGLKWPMLAVSLLAIVLSWKYGAILDWFIDSFPGFNKFRDTKMMLILPQLAFPFLAILFLHQLIAEKLPVKKLLIVSGAVILFFGILYAMPDTFFDFSNQAEQEMLQEQRANYAGNSSVQAQLVQFEKELIDVRINIMQDDLQRTLLFLILTAALVVIFAMGKMKPWMLYLTMGLIILIDLWAVDKRYLNDEKMGSQYVNWIPEFEYLNSVRSTEADIQILNAELTANSSLKNEVLGGINALKNDEGYSSNEFNMLKEKEAFRLLNLNTSYRVFSLSNPFANSQPSYFHKSIGGYHGAKLKKYQEVIDFYLMKEYSMLMGAEKKGFDPGMVDYLMREEINILNMLNTKYITYGQGGKIMENPYRYGNAWFVNSIQWVENADKEILALGELNKNHAVIRSAFQKQVNVPAGRDTTATIQLVSYEPNHLVYEANSASGQFAVFSEIYYPFGWEAKINNQPAEIVPVNYILRGLTVPSGKSTIEFTFVSSEIKTGRAIGMTGTILILILAAVVGFIEFKKKGVKA